MYCAMCIKNYYRSGEQVYDNGINIQQFQTGWWNSDNYIPLTEVASFQASKFGTNMFKQNTEAKMDKPWVLVH
jgi:hypothetical protein